jgi:hypothetical protein
MNDEKLICEDCQAEYTKPAVYREYAAREGDFFFKRNLKYCDGCRRGRELKMLENLPQVLNALVNSTQ